MKLRFKVIIIVAVFAVALFIFSGGIRRTFFITGAQTVAMSGSSLPTVTLKSGDCEVNRLYGYVSPIDVMTVRETMTPLRQDRTFTVLIHESVDTVKKLKYEIFADDGHTVEEGSLTVLDPESGPKNVRIALTETMKSGHEYPVRLTLVTNNSKRIYYYTRLKMYEDGNLAEKLDFVNFFHDTLLSGTEAERKSLGKYLETAKGADASTYAHLDITSPVDMLCWGELEPTVLWEEVPIVNEFYDAMATMTLRTMVGVKTEYGTERFIVEEHFRLNYTPIRVYLYNYERTMEAVFDVSHTSLMKNEFKLGITSDIEAPTAASPSGGHAAFVYGRELYEYEAEKNELVRVFSARSGEAEAEPENAFHDDHEVRLLNIYDSGDIDFVVLGYMDRGEYEGRVGIILYRYVAADRRIEERLYIPITTTYGMLAAEMEDMTYLSAKDVFYFAVYGSIYSYDLLTRELNVLAEGVPSGNIVFCREEGYLCWQVNDDIMNSERLCVLSMETGELHDIKPADGAFIKLLGRIDNNIVYGEASPADVVLRTDGSTELPLYRLFIEDGRGKMLKEYESADRYVGDVTINGSMMTIELLKRSPEHADGYEPAGTDSIMDKAPSTKRIAGINKRVTDRTLTEYYVYLPEGIDITAVPTKVETKNTVINFSTTVRIDEREDRAETFYASSFGRIILATDDAARAINAASDAVGTVFCGNGRVVWERGVKSARSYISGLVTIDSSETMSSVQAAMWMLLKYKNLDIDTRDYVNSSMTIRDYLSQEMVSTPIDLSGATLDEVLYYVYKERPVIAIGPEGSGYLIIGYDGTAVTCYDPARGKEISMETAQAAQTFEEGGSMFVSFID